MKEGAGVVVEKVGREALEAGAEKAGKEALEAGAKRTTAEVLEQLAKLAKLAKHEGDDIAKVVAKTAAEEAKDLLDDILKQFDPKTATNKQKGNFGEIASQKNMLDNPNLTRIGDKAPKGLDDTIKKGIDGIYENSKPPPKYIIDEAKYGTSQLGKTADGKQMSDKWVRNRLEKQLGEDKARDVMKAMEAGEVDKVISKIDKFGSVKTYKVDANGTIGNPWP